MNFTAGFQSAGNSFYDQLWRYPEWGIGYYSVSLFNDAVCGNPNALYLFVDVPFHHPGKNRWRYSYSLGGGLSYNFRPNNPQDNPWNTLIGSYNNVYIEFGFWVGRNLGKSCYLAEYTPKTDFVRVNLLTVGIMADRYVTFTDAVAAFAGA